MAPEVSKPVLTPKIINFEQGRKALEKGTLELSNENGRIRCFATTGLSQSPSIQVAFGRSRNKFWRSLEDATLKFPDLFSSIH